MRDNSDLIKEVKDSNEEVFKWSEIEKKILRQRSEINWLRLGVAITDIYMLKSRLNMVTMI